MCFRIRAVQSSLVVSVLVLTSLIALVMGCGIESWTELRASESKSPLTLFGRYSLHLRGDCFDSCGIEIKLKFLQPVNDKTPLDSIPIVAVDSLCFEWVGNDAAYCRKSLWQYQLSLGCARVRTEGLEKDRTADLEIQNGTYQLMTMVMEGGIHIPSGYANKPVRISIHARLLARRTSAELRRETRQLQCESKRRHRFYSNILQ